MIIIRFLSTVSYKRFKEFLNSLDEEYDSWSLDLQAFKDDKELYNKTIKVRVGAIISIDTDTDKIVGFCNIYSHLGFLKDTLYDVSFVVKKEYQNRGIGTKMLLTIEDVLKLCAAEYITAKHFEDNIASHKAFLKAGYEKWIYTKSFYLSNGTKFVLNPKVNKTMDWKIKNIYEKK
jgi:RimJ/RimL family protein N-acetyltransferase